MNINLLAAPGSNVWQSEYMLLPAIPLEIGPHGEMTASTSYLHGRSVCLGEKYIAGAPKYLFVKGVGWTHGWINSWSSDLGSLGIFPLRAAIWERNAAQQCIARGLPSSMPLAIVEKESLPGVKGERIAALEVADLDGSPARPAVYYHATHFRQRICEWREIPLDDRPALLQEITGRTDKVGHEDYLYFMADAMARAAAIFHAVGGHNYAASSHNMTIGGELVDFEYAVLDTPHWEPALNSNPESWQDKELLGWLQTLAELFDVFEVNLNRPKFAHSFVCRYLNFGGNESLEMVRAILADHPDT